MSAPDTAVEYEVARRTPFDPPMVLRTAGPLRRLRYPDGHLGWLVTDDRLARAVLADGRFSARSEFKRPPVRRPGIEPFYGAPALPGWLVDMDRPEHTRIRRALARHFSSRRVQAALRERVVAIVGTQLDAMVAAGAPADLVTDFALPVPSLAICEVLGVPYADRARFQELSAALFSLDTDRGGAAAAMTELDGYLRGLVRRRRGAPTRDLLGDLAGSSDLTDPEIAGAGVLLLTAGHETTANCLSLAVFALLVEPEQWAAVPLDVAAVTGPVEELLRYLTVFHLGVPRTPLTDVELAGRTLRRGETVTVALAVANRDPDRFPDPDRLDLRRPDRGHLAFGHGLHQCVGQHLARLELQVALHALVHRLPGLRLARPPEDVELATDMGVYGLHALPVTW
jgi:cytochrome P450